MTYEIAHVTIAQDCLEKFGSRLLESAVRGIVVGVLLLGFLVMFAHFAHRLE